MESRFTITLQEMTDLSIPIFSDDIETIVAEQIDTTFTSEKWSTLKTRYYQHYKYREIGFETVDMYYDYFIDSFLSNIDKFKDLWNVTITNKLDNNSSTIKTSLVNSDLPFNELDPLSDYASFKSENESDSSASTNQSQMEGLKKYNNDYQDIDSQWLDSFNDLFMGVL